MSRGIPPNTPGPSYSFGKAERFPKQKQSETPGPGAYNPNQLKSGPSHSFSKEKRFQNSTKTTSHSKKVRDLIPPFTRSPARMIDSKKIDQMILNDAKEAGSSYLNKMDPEHLEHTYTFQNRDKTKTLKFIGISHLDNLKRHIKKHPSEKDALLAKINQFMKKLKTVIKGSDPKHATLIIEGMGKFTPGNSKEDQKAFIATLKGQYPEGMNWADPDIKAFIKLQNASELNFAVLLAAEKRMKISSSESDMNQVIELCRRLEEPESLEGFIPDQFKLDLKECAFFYFCCRDLIRWHS